MLIAVLLSVAAVIGGTALLTFLVWRILKDVEPPNE